MDETAISHLTQQVHDEADKRFPDVIQQVEVLQYGDEPVIEPGELMVRVTIAAADGEEGREQSLHEFETAHGPAIKQFRRDLSAQLPEVGRLEFRTSGGPGHGPGIMLGGGRRRSLDARAMEGGDLTPVMTRLGPVDLETLDALITAGIAGSRAEAVRWALARIRERPAYAQLRERAAEIERLKTEF